MLVRQSVCAHLPCNSQTAKAKASEANQIIRSALKMFKLNITIHKQSRLKLSMEILRITTTFRNS